MPPGSGFLTLLGSPSETSFLKLYAELRVELKRFLSRAAQRVPEFS